MTVKEGNKDFFELCNYIHDEILQYSSDMKIPKYLILRLRGLAKGQFMANTKQTPHANYEYKIILYTFRICRARILQYMISNQTKFNNEQHKINSIMIFIENEINDVVLRLKKAKSSEEKIINLQLDNQINEGSEYKRKEEKNNNNLKDLW